MTWRNGWRRRSCDARRVCPVEPIPPVHCVGEGGGPVRGHPRVTPAVDQAVAGGDAPAPRTQPSEWLLGVALTVAVAIVSRGLLALLPPLVAAPIGDVVIAVALGFVIANT